MLLEDPGQSPAPIQEASHASMLPKVLIALAVLYAAVSLYFLIDMHNRLSKAEAQLAATSAQASETADQLHSTRTNMKESLQALGQKVGMTSEELDKRTEALSRAQSQAAAKLAKEQAAQGQQLSQVSGEVGNVKTDLGSAKTDIASTRTDLDATKKKLETAIGDLNVQSGLIAHTRDDLEFLKHKGDRNIYEFTLAKGHKEPVSTVSLELKKADRKKGKFTLNVIADDRTIEKKDRTLYEPMQFYTGRDKMLYEVVVMSVDKDKITGYLSAPKNAPQPLAK
jgi:multidrug efflux pump subunit AcrA (membrane-fusion protein)